MPGGSLGLVPLGCGLAGLAGQRRLARLACARGVLSVGRVPAVVARSHLALLGLLLGGLLSGLGLQAGLPSFGACDQTRYEGTDHHPVISLELLAVDPLPQLMEAFDGDVDARGHGSYRPARI